MCLMAKGNSKVGDEESESDDELDPNAFANLIHEYTSMIKKEKAKFKVLEEVHAKLKSDHSSLYNKYTALLKEHDKLVALAKQLEVDHKDLKLRHKELTHKYQELEFSYEAIDTSLDEPSVETPRVEKVNASTSCEDLLMDDLATNSLPKNDVSRERELERQVASLKTSVHYPLAQQGKEALSRDQGKLHQRRWCLLPTLPSHQAPH